MLCRNPSLSPLLGLALTLTLAPGLTACGEEVSALPYGDETVVIGGPNGESQPYQTPSGDECLNLDDVCLQPQNECGDGERADVLVDDDGAVIDVICYPSEGVVVEDFEGDVMDVGNNVVLLLDGDADGVDVDGDVTIDGNNVTVWGEGPDVSVISGDLTIDKNNTLVRGVRIQGDVKIHQNNPSMVDCVIEGNLVIEGNNVSVALCEVWGEIQVKGNNAILVSNLMDKAPAVEGENLVCNDNHLFVDENEDGDISEGELGDAVDCDTP